MDRLELEGEVKKCRAPPELIFFCRKSTELPQPFRKYHPLLAPEILDIS